ncbi:hypothetical protein Tco_0455156 [Tanacetum coccineum]
MIPLMKMMMNHFIPILPLRLKTSPPRPMLSRVRKNPPHESHNLNTYLSETLNLQTQQRDAYWEGLRSIGQALKNMMSGKRKLGAKFAGLLSFIFVMVDDSGEEDISSLLSSFTATIKNIEGAMIGPDEKPLEPKKTNASVTFQDNANVFKLDEAAGIDTIVGSVTFFNYKEQAARCLIGCDGVMSDGNLKSCSALKNRDSPKSLSTGWEDHDVNAMRPTIDEADSQPKSFASIVNGTRKARPNPKVNFRKMETQEKVENSDFVLPIDAMQVVHNKYVNSLVGFFVGKKVVFTLVKNYVLNTWAKFGFQKIMCDEDGFYYFKFESITGLEQVLEQGPWLIKNTLIILNKWTPNLVLSKDQVTRVPVWVKMHKVPIVAFSDGRIGFARALIEVSVENELKEEYEWKPPLCNECHVFGHVSEKYPKRVPEIPKTVEEIHDDGFIPIVNKKNKGKATGPKKPQQNSSNQVLNNNGAKADQINVVELKNHFDQLRDQDDTISMASVGELSRGKVSLDESRVGDPTELDSESEVEEIEMEQAPTPKQSEVLQVVNENQLNVCAILESHVDLSCLSNVCSKVFHSWEWTSNASLCNLQSQRRLLWAELGVHKISVRDHPWILMGDFNVALNMEDTYAGSSSLNASMYEFKDCVSNIEVTDINSLGMHFTWNQKPNRGNVILKKLDLIMGNMEFMDAFPGAFAVFHPYRISNHSLVVLKLPSLPSTKPKPFKFFNFLTYKNRFLELISNGWNTHVEGHNMFQIVSKLKRLKKPIRKLLHDHGNLHERVNKLRAELDEVQKALDSNPTDSTLRDEESVRIEVICNADNVEVLGSLVPNVFVDHYNSDGLFANQIATLTAEFMVREVTNEEIKAAMFDIGEDKAPGPDGYTSAFFKKGWDIFGIKEVVSENQSAFVPGRRISDNILITHELMHNYHRNRGPPRCAFKVDIQKAYDTVDWAFLENILVRFGFPNKMVKWIMACVSSTSFSLTINGNIHGFFKGKRWLRQGDPLSPYLFTLVMEILTLIFKRRVRNSNEFHYHNHCEKLEIIDICFAVDLFIFARGDVESARVIMESLDEFKMVSGMVLSIPKSTAYFCNVLHHVKLSILSIMSFSEGELPVKYLGVPLISSRLMNRDCKILYKRGKAKVAWESICLPKKEGGLGLRSLDVFNIALMTTHIWNTVTHKESLWVHWIHTYKLRGRTFWDIPIQADMSWGWRKLLQLRDIVRPFFWVKISNGYNTSLWHDNWCLSCPLSHFLSPRDITREGYHLQTNVAKLIDNGEWVWPHSWVNKAPILGQLMVPVLEGSLADLPQWRDSNDVFSEFSVAKAWEAIRPRGNMVDWYRIPMGNKRTACSVFGKLILAASAYFIWLERNNRVFKKVKKSPKDIHDMVKVTVRLKLLSFRFKMTNSVELLLSRWKMPTSFRIYGDV